LPVSRIRSKAPAATSTQPISWIQSSAPVSTASLPISRIHSIPVASAATASQPISQISDTAPAVTPSKPNDVISATRQSNSLGTQQQASDNSDLVPAVSQVQNFLATLLTLHQPGLTEQHQQLKSLMEIISPSIAPLSDKAPQVDPVPQRRERVCKVVGCKFCSREACGKCGNCKTPRRNKCIRR
jgi:hypothetical protein